MGTTRKVQMRKVLKKWVYSGPDSPLQTWGIEKIALARVARLGWVILGLMYQGVLGFSNSRTILIRTSPVRTFLLATHFVPGPHFWNLSNFIKKIGQVTSLG